MDLAELEVSLTSGLQVQTLPQLLLRFLPTKENGLTKEDKTLWKAKHHVMKVLYMHSVLQGIVDFCDAMFEVSKWYEREL
jgi:hypothetical protein